jgi:hypothetical protein
MAAVLALEYCAVGVILSVARGDAEVDLRQQREQAGLEWVDAALPLQFEAALTALGHLLKCDLIVDQPRVRRVTDGLDAVACSIVLLSSTSETHRVYTRQRGTIDDRSI